MQDIKLTIIYMRILKNFTVLFFLTAFIISCVDENESNADFVGTISEPTNISALVSITQDNTGLVTITPTGEGVVTFHVDYGDGSDISGSINPGNSTDHTYMEGTYEATIIGTALDGSTAEGNVTIVVAFIAPENLVVNLISSSGSYNILVSATADYATSFEVLFGDEAGGDATPMQLGEQLSHTYESAGTYNLIVTALSGGSATTQYSEDVVITDPPVFDGFSTFEDFEGEVPSNFSFGGDAKISIGNGMNLDLTLNPDFSQVEVDDQIVNLTRFEINLPEKRQFFIHNSELFASIGDSRDSRAFFSRRIGVAKDIDGNTIENRIIGGLRLSGKITDNLRIGFLNMQTEQDKSNKISSNNNMVLSLQQRVFSKSNINLFFINRENTGNSNFINDQEKFNRVFGVDYLSLIHISEPTRLRRISYAVFCV